MTTTTQTTHDHGHTRRSLLLGVIVWFVHLNVVYGVASLACRWTLLGSTYVGMGITILQLVEVILTLITSVVMLVLIYLPWRNWRAYQTQAPPSNPKLLEDTEKDRRPLVAGIVMVLNSFFLLFVVSFLVPIFTLAVCNKS